MFNSKGVKMSAWTCWKGIDFFFKGIDKMFFLKERGWDFLINPCQLFFQNEGKKVKKCWW